VLIPAAECFRLLSADASDSGLTSSSWKQGPCVEYYAAGKR